MLKIERVKAALRGESIDRPPYSLWMHFPDHDQSATLLAEKNAQFARQYDLDYIVSMPCGTFTVEDWGTVGDHSALFSGGFTSITKYAVNSIDDWRRIKKLDVTKGVYGRELEQLRLLVKKVGKEQPVIATIYSPLTIMKKLAGDQYRQHIQERPEIVHSALHEIALTGAEFAKTAIEAGCAGIYLSTQETTSEAVTPAIYEEFGARYDLQLLKAADAGWFNVLHIHGTNILFDVVADYPVHALNWHVHETAPSLAEYISAGGTKPVLGGLRRMEITRGNMSAVRQDIADALRVTKGRKLLFGPACVIHYPVEEAALEATAKTLSTAA